MDWLYQHWTQQHTRSCYQPKTSQATWTQEGLTLWLCNGISKVFPLRFDQLHFITMWPLKVQEVGKTLVTQGNLVRPSFPRHSCFFSRNSLLDTLATLYKSQSLRTPCLCKWFPAPHNQQQQLSHFCLPRPWKQTQRGTVKKSRHGGKWDIKCDIQT